MCGGGGGAFVRACVSDSVGGGGCADECFE